MPKNQKPRIPDPPTTLEEAQRLAVRKAFSDLLGASGPFDALTWMRTLPAEWQKLVRQVIVYVYHHEENPPGLED